MIYLTKGGKVPEPPLIQGLPEHETIHIFRYWNIKRWEVPVESLKQEGQLGLRPLCLLAQGAISTRWQRTSLTTLTQEKDWLGLALAFAALVFDSTADEEWLEGRLQCLKISSVILRSIKRYWDEGHKEGEEKGVQKALRTVILDVVRTRFPDG